MSLVRVFPRRTQATPDDDLAFIGPPPLFLPQIQEIHISVAFTWEVAWGHIAPVLIGYPKDTLAAAEKRLRAVGMPFAMLYRDAQIGVGVSVSG